MRTTEELIDFIREQRKEVSKKAPFQNSGSSISAPSWLGPQPLHS